MELTTQQRLDRMERSMRRMRASVITVSLVAVVLAVSGMHRADSSAQHVIASRFTLVDANQNPTAELRSAEEAHGAELVFLDSNGRPRMQLQMAQHEAEMGDDGIFTSILLTGANPEQAILLGAGSNVRQFSINDLQGNTRIRLSTSQGGAPQLTSVNFSLHDQNETPMLRLGLAPMTIPRPERRTTDGPRGGDVQLGPSPFIWLGHERETRASFRLWHDGRPSLDLWDDDDTPIFRVPDAIVQ